MTNQEIIEQLKSLKIHCEDFREDEECIWAKDVEALDKAIEALEEKEHRCNNCDFAESAGAGVYCILYSYRRLEDYCSEWERR